MTHWNRDAVVKALQADLEDITITTPIETGGDWDCPPIIVKVNGHDDQVLIAPYLDPDDRGDLPPIEDRMDIDVYVVEVKNAYGDCRGGCNSDNERFSAMFGICVARLRQLGFNIINHYDEIF